MHVTSYTSFVKRVAEAAVEEFVRRYVNIMLAGLAQVRWGKGLLVLGSLCLNGTHPLDPHQITPELVARLRADENDVESYFSTHLKPDKLSKFIDQLSDIRELVSSTE